MLDASRRFTHASSDFQNHLPKNTQESSLSFPSCEIFGMVWFMAESLQQRCCAYSGDVTMHTGSKSTAQDNSFRA
jgi:hypothetical protein